MSNFTISHNREREMQGSQEHIVMLPFMAQGHLIPFLELAQQIQQRTGFKITLANTPLNINYLSSTISTNNSSTNISLIELPFNSENFGLPPNVQNTEALSLNQIITLFHSSRSLESPFFRLISDIIAKDKKPPLCIISDMFMGWACDVAKSFGTVHVSFTTGGAYGTAAYVSIWQNLPHRYPGSENGFRVPGFPDSCLFHPSQLHPFLRAADGTDPWSKFFQPQIALSLGSIGWLCNTVEEFEPFGLEILRSYTKLPMWCIGPLLPPGMLNKSIDSGIIGQRTGRTPGLSADKCIEWLNLHSQDSVLYISFGSQNTISASQMMELANGLEDSGKPFVWVIRPPVGFDLKGEFRSKWLPEGFEKRMAEKNQGLVVHKWAPQLEILCHKSTGAFLSHCGWNSVLESLSQGVPIIGWPLAAEQGYNAKMLIEDMGVCIELNRGVQSSITREKVKRVVEEAMGMMGKGKEMREKAAKIGDLIRASAREEDGIKGSSLHAMDDFVSTLLSNRSVPAKN